MGTPSLPLPVKLVTGLPSPARERMAAAKEELETACAAPSRGYLGNGIHGQTMLVYSNGSYRPLDWTYPDYREASTIAFFNEARALYKRQIRSMT